MLVRDPAGRASLEEITNHSWLNLGETATSTLPLTPLVTRENVAPEDHASIVQYMIEKKIAQREEVIQ